MIVKNVEKQENSKVTFQVEVDAAAFEAAIASAYKKNRNSIFVSGFRKGKAPRAVIEGMYGSDIFHDDAAQLLAQDAFTFAVKDAELKNVGIPSYLDFKVDDENKLTLSFSTDVYPEVELGEYKGLEAEYFEAEFDEDAVEKEIEAARKRGARYIEVERPVQEGDTVVFDYAGFSDGVQFDGGTAEDHTLEIGSGSFIPGFEEGMIGMERDVEGEVNVTFPEAYHSEELAGKPAVFKVKIKAIREPEYPELDDEFAKDVSEFDTFEEYKNSVREKLQSREKAENEREFKSSLLYMAVENMKCDVPDGLVDEKLDDLIGNYAQNMGFYGPREKFFEAMQIDEATFGQIMRPNAYMQAQTDLLLDKIAEVENIEVTEEDKEELYKQISEAYGQSIEEIKESIIEELMLRDLTRQKAADIIYESAVKLPPAPKPEASDEAEDSASAPEADETATEGEAAE